MLGLSVNDLYAETIDSTMTMLQRHFLFFINFRRFWPRILYMRFNNIYIEFIERTLRCGWKISSMNLQ